MQLLALSLVSATTAAALSIPTALNPRRILAGGPSVTPIPSNCTLTSITPSSNSSSDEPTAFTTTTDFTSAHTVFQQGIPSYSGENTTAAAETCLEQCYGFGNLGQCVSALWAQNVSYEAYGAENVGNVCWMFDTVISPEDLVEVDNGSFQGARAVNIACPSPRGS